MSDLSGVCMGKRFQAYIAAYQNLTKNGIAHRFAEGKIKYHNLICNSDRLTRPHLDCEENPD